MGAVPDGLVQTGRCVLDCTFPERPHDQQCVASTKKVRDLLEKGNVGLTVRNLLQKEI